MVTLPGCDELFLRYFDRWYDEEDRRRKGFIATRPDMHTANSLGPLSEMSQRDVLRRIEAMLEAARKDWPRYLQVSGDVDLRWITTFDCHYDPDCIEEVIRAFSPRRLQQSLCRVFLFAAVLGHVMRCLQPRLIWCCEWPYWESALLDPQTGNLIPVFHWAVKKMSAYGWDDGFALKVEVCLQHLEKRE